MVLEGWKIGNKVSLSALVVLVDRGFSLGLMVKGLWKRVE